MRRSLGKGPLLEKRSSKDQGAEKNWTEGPTTQRPQRAANLTLRSFLLKSFATFLNDSWQKAKKPQGEAAATQGGGSCQRGALGVLLEGSTEEGTSPSQPRPHRGDQSTTVQASQGDRSVTAQTSQSHDQPVRRVENGEDDLRNLCSKYT